MRGEPKREIELKNSGGEPPQSADTLEQKDLRLHTCLPQTAALNALTQMLHVNMIGMSRVLLKVSSCLKRVSTACLPADHF